MTEPKSRIVYFGTPQVAVAPLRALHDAGHEVVLVVTRPPRRRGRREAPTPSPVAAAAAELGLDVTWDPGQALDADAGLGVVVAYGELIVDEVLLRRRTVNLHFSLLPRWRGAAPVERAILAGDTETGVCLMEVVSELDAGGVYRRAHAPITPHSTADRLRAELCELGIAMLLEALAEGFGEPQPQSGEVTWAHKITPSELRIDWTAPAHQVTRLVRVGGAWTTFRGKRLKVLEACPQVRSEPGTGEGQPVAAAGLPQGRGAASQAESESPGTILSPTGPEPSDAVLVASADGWVELVTVQSEGRRATSAREWSNGARITGGEKFDA